MRPTDLDISWQPCWNLVWRLLWTGSLVPVKRVVRAVCDGLGIIFGREQPDFRHHAALYRWKIPVAHFDTYRLEDLDEFVSIGADEYLLSRGMACLIEWADKISNPAGRSSEH
ncbi:MAG: tRNA (adenosine(37)-N6)-threonylcarbamoyltransferase complex ATPase subunit type 1 TsaE [Planctomycetaceae bacterium]